jgi:GxxExxY protein
LYGLNATLSGVAHVVPTHKEFAGAEAELSFKIIGCAMEVLNQLGHGFHEKPYENALIVEFQLRHLEYQQQRCFPISYKGVWVADFRPDLIVNQAVVVDTKVVDKISDIDRGQMLNYLAISKLRVGLLLNFKRPKLDWVRLVV